MHQQSPVVFLLDDDPDVRDSLALLLRSVGLRTQAFASCAALRSGWDPSLIGCLILDIRMPGESGLQMLESLTGQGIDLPVIMLTGHGDLNACRRAFRGGAVEFLTKPVDEVALIEAVQSAIRLHIERRDKNEVTQQAKARLACLTSREREVLANIAEGLSNKQIAQLLGLSPRTVESHRANLFEKLEVNSLAQLVRLYWLGLESP
jgi:two-component system, LuxR family, response regulator FixJ